MNSDDVFAFLPAGFSLQTSERAQAKACGYKTTAL
jgi:hypothetical protein